MRMPLLNCNIQADDLDHAYLFKRILHQVAPEKNLLTASNGEELLDLLWKVHPEYLFMDLKMPCKNGVECLQEIRNSPAL